MIFNVAWTTEDKGNGKEGREDQRVSEEGETPTKRYYYHCPFPAVKYQGHRERVSKGFREPL